MNSAAPLSRLTLTQWLVILIAVIGFAFDTYELLMFPLIGGPAVAELLQLPANNPLVTEWLGKMLWITALCGGMFGLLGGWLTDRFGRKTILAASIALYSLSPAMAALSTSIGQFVFFRSATFVGVCVEFVAAITWLAELFPDRKQKEKALGWTQAFASFGGLMVTGVNVWILAHAAALPALPVAEPFNPHGSWRFLLLTGLIPALPIALLLPFVPESQVWLERRKAGTLRRPSFGELFSPALRRATLVTATLSACAYAAAFGALQLTPTRIVPGLPDLAEQRQVLRPLQEDAKALNQQLVLTNLPPFARALADTPGLRELAGQRAKVRQAVAAARRGLDSDQTPAEQKTQLKAQLGGLTNRLAELDQQLTQLTSANPDAKKAVLEREKTLGQLAANRARQEPADTFVKARGNQVQLWQELGGLLGRIALALLVVTALRRGTLLRLFLGPGLFLFTLTYVSAFRQHPELFQWGIALCGFVTVAQFSYLGEYLPKVFPIHLRGTGGSFATNVGGRMIGTSAAFVTTSLVAPRLPGHDVRTGCHRRGHCGLDGFPHRLRVQLPAPGAGAERTGVTGCFESKLAAPRNCMTDQCADSPISIHLRKILPTMCLDHSPRPTIGRALFSLIWLVWLGAAPLTIAAEAQGKPDHVVLVVFDGMRPDFVTPQYTPNLYALATNGVFFRRNHCVYVSTTIVNGTALATGVHPGHSGILANNDFHPEMNSQSAIASEALDTVRRGDLLSHGKYIAVDTLAELIQDAGHATDVAGTKVVPLMHDRKLRRTDTAAHSNSVTLFRGATLPRSALEPLVKVNDDKAFPDTFTAPNTAADAWTTKALTRGLWKKGVPTYSLLWLSDPDATQHAKGVGSPEALSGIESSDHNLGEVIKVLKEKGVYDRTDIMVVSDHGFSTIVRSADITEALRRRGIKAFNKMDNPEPGDVLVVGLGGSALIYVLDQREDVIRKTVEVLQTSDFTGVIFSHLDIEGTFPLTAIRYPVTTNAPDLVVSMRWLPDLNDFGAPGLIIATGGSRNGGTHGSLSRYDMNNTLVASGPDFKRGFISDIPSGNIDVAPTILHLLGITPREPMDGRVLREALAGHNDPAPEVKEQKFEAGRRSGFMQWNQYLKTLEVDGALYFDEGNGEAKFQ